MTSAPACVNESDPFPHKSEVAAALAAGANARRDERELTSSSLLGTYQIRLRIEEGLKLSAQAAQQQDRAVEDLRFLVNRLSQYPGATIIVWYIHATNGARYVLMENSQSKAAIGCIAVASNISVRDFRSIPPA